MHPDVMPDGTYHFAGAESGADMREPATRIFGTATSEWLFDSAEVLVLSELSLGA
jgi:hypothetical protein